MKATYQFTASAIAVLFGITQLANAQTTREGQNVQALTGAVSYANDCTVAQIRFHEEIVRFGRTAAVSSGFSQALKSTLRTTYKVCAGDPFETAAAEERIAAVVRIVMSPNAIAAQCTGGSGNASSAIGQYGHQDAERFAWSSWLTSVREQLTQPVCARPGDGNCRAGAFPWPYTQAAGVIWHEAMHTHGYGHGDNTDNGAAMRACRQTSNPGWNFQVNTAPYIVGDTLANFIQSSSAQCDGTRGCPKSTQKRMLNSAGACECVSDPGPRPFRLEITVPTGNPVFRVGVPATFTGTMNPPVGYPVQWEFADGGRATGESVGHTFNRPGRYVVVARVSFDASSAKAPEEASLIVTVR